MYSSVEVPLGPVEVPDLRSGSAATSTTLRFFDFFVWLLPNEQVVVLYFRRRLKFHVGTVAVLRLLVEEEVDHFSANCNYRVRGSNTAVPKICSDLYLVRLFTG
jgi:hypothetical protein